ncbi:MAG: glycosyltransferase family 2 protein [Candidatus Eisenbacteria bacterium]|uniref:Glycosyltransferase family 2 protein n=1 Tax=Eiseniibacteriota bacterium TaxID=2212470 RepID=A0A849SK69_UNCEI|nr:glycosyltransferase family 2 protein [Candidatus Eisenbacteria bacterium]
MWGDVALRLSDRLFGRFVLIYGALLFAQYFVLGVLAFVDARRELRRQQVSDRLSLFEGDLAPPISILVPAYNEGPTIVDSIRSLMHLRYPSFEIIVVNDGSKDGTLQAMVDAFGLRPSLRTLRARVPQERVRGVYSSPDYPFLVVLDTVNGGKAQSLNMALAVARHPLFCAIDADSMLERDTLLQLALPFYLDASVIVTGGVVRPANGSLFDHGRMVKARVSRRALVRLQTVEYLRGMLAGRMGWNLMDSLFIVSGALGLFSRDAVLAVGGFRTDTLGEDMELIMRLQRWARRNGRRRAVRFVGSAVAWTEVPENLRTLSRQRGRWHQGLAESLWLNRQILLTERFAIHHGIAFLSQLLFELFGPVIELTGLALTVVLVATGHLHSVFPLLYLALFVAGGIVNSLLGLALETVVCPRYTRGREFLILMAYAVLENLGYRQLMAWFRVRGLWNAMRKRKAWGVMARKGHAAATDSSEIQRAA